jgi:hypothetical protein
MHALPTFQDNNDDKFLDHLLPKEKKRKKIEFARFPLCEHCSFL